MDKLYEFFLSYHCRLVQVNAIQFTLITSLVVAYVAFVYRYLQWGDLTPALKVVFTSVVFHVLIGFINLAVSLFMYRTLKQTSFIALVFDESRVIIKKGRPFFADIGEEESQALMEFCVETAKKDRQFALLSQKSQRQKKT